MAKKLKIVLTKAIELDEDEMQELANVLNLEDHSNENIEIQVAHLTEIEEIIDYYLEKDFFHLDTETEIIDA